MPSSSVADILAAQRARFRAFVIARLGNEAEADDLLQDSMVRALRTARQVREEQKLTAWFYQLLRNAVIDHVRSRGAARARDDAWAAMATLEEDQDAARHVCSCFEALLPELKMREAELLRRVELQNMAVADAARELGMTPNHASVTLHRARKSLREKLEAFCGSCAGSACLDCDCQEP